MDTLNNDVTNIIFKQISAFDKLQLYTVFNEPRPTQFQVSYELMASKDLYGHKGHIMRAITTPIEFTSTYDRIYNYNATMDMIEEQLKIDNYEPCVQVMVLIQKQLHIIPWNTREDSSTPTSLRISLTNSKSMSPKKSILLWKSSSRLSRN